jgi:hypothetical protein
MVPSALAGKRPFYCPQTKRFSRNLATSKSLNAPSPPSRSLGSLFRSSGCFLRLHLSCYMPCRELYHPFLPYHSLYLSRAIPGMEALVLWFGVGSLPHPSYCALASVWPSSQVQHQRQAGYVLFPSSLGTYRPSRVQLYFWTHTLSSPRYKNVLAWVVGCALSLPTVPRD